MTHLKKTLVKKMQHTSSYHALVTIFGRTEKKIDELCKRFRKKTDINIVLTLFKIGSLFSCKDRLPNALRSFVVYKFTCAEGKSCYIGETTHHLAARIKEHLVTDKKSHIMKPLLENKTCKNLPDKSFFSSH